MRRTVQTSMLAKEAVLQFNRRSHALHRKNHQDDYLIKHTERASDMTEVTLKCMRKVAERREDIKERLWCEIW